MGGRKLGWDTADDGRNHISVWYSLNTNCDPKAHIETFGPQLEALFGKVVGPLGSGISLGTEGHYWVGWLLRLYSQLLLPAHSLLPMCRCSVTSQPARPAAMSSPP